MCVCGVVGFGVPLGDVMICVCKGNSMQLCGGTGKKRRGDG